jgi:hypothetical protein
MLRGAEYGVTCCMSPQRQNIAFYQPTTYTKRDSTWALAYLVIYKPKILKNQYVNNIKMDFIND